MSNLADDDIAASRIHHSDGSSAGDDPVVGTAAVIHSVLSRFNPNAPSFSSAESAWITGMMALTS